MTAERPIIIAAASRPYPGEVVSGDAWGVVWHQGVCRIAVIDGLGHGPRAAEAADAALTLLSTQPHLAPDAALRACHRALSHTRGAAMAVAAINPCAGSLTYAGVGNIEALLWHAGREQRPISYRGIVGATLPTVRSFEIPLPAGWLLIMHTDGVNSRFDRGLLDRSHASPQALADAVLSQCGRMTDDATVVVASPTA